MSLNTESDTQPSHGSSGLEQDHGEASPEMETGSNAPGQMVSGRLYELTIDDAVRNDTLRNEFTEVVSSEWGNTHTPEIIQGSRS
jgi:hypothetical protein